MSASEFVTDLRRRGGTPDRQPGRPCRARSAAQCSASTPATSRCAATDAIGVTWPRASPRVMGQRSAARQPTGRSRPATGAHHIAATASAGR